MRRVLLAALAGVAVVGLLAAWRTPTVALVRLKLALDRHDLAAVERALDVHALTDVSLASLVDGKPGETESIRLALRGRGGWLPAMESARAYLGVRLERAIERLVEEPEGMLRVGWSDLRASLGTLRRSGAVAFFLFRRGDGTEYVVRMRQADGRWRIVSVEQSGNQALLVPVTAARNEPPAPPPAAAAATSAPAPVPALPPAAAPEPRPLTPETRYTMMNDALEPPATPRRVPPPRGRQPRPFPRRLDGAAWTVQVASTKDPGEAASTRDWFAQRGEPAFVLPVTVRGESWQRVLVGRYATRTEAERTVARLTDDHGAERVTD